MHTTSISEEGARRRSGGERQTRAAPAARERDPPRDAAELAQLAAELPLERTWAIWYNARERPPPGRGRGAARPEAQQATYSAAAAFGTFGTVKTLWEWMNNLPTPSNLRQDVNVFIFQQDVDPAWEHPANRAGGRWTCTYDQGNAAAADTAWQSMYLALAGETLEESVSVTGITATRRQHYVRLAVWTRNREDEPAVMSVGRSLKALVTTAHLEYQDHGGSVRHTLA